MKSVELAWTREHAAKSLTHHMSYELLDSRRKKREKQRKETCTWRSVERHIFKGFRVGLELAAESQQSWRSSVLTSSYVQAPTELEYHVCP